MLEGTKAAQINSLKIDREAPVSRAKPVKWFLLISILGGLGIAGWFVFGNQSAKVLISTTVASAAGGDSRRASVLDATGYIVARRQATVSSKATGKVVSVLIEEGMAVVKDQLLATLDDSIPLAQRELAQSQVLATQAGLKALAVQHKQSELTLNRTEELAERKLASAADLDRDRLVVEGLVAQLERAKQEVEVGRRNLAVRQQVLDDMQIRAPFAGVVVAKSAQPGEMISPVSAGGGFTRTGICTIVDMTSLEVEVDVNESYINRVKAGQKAQVALNAYPNNFYSASVIAIIPSADRNKATVRVRVGIQNLDARILPDMGVRVAFLGAEIEKSTKKIVTVASHAVAGDEMGKYVYVARSGAVTKRRLTLAGAHGALSQVTSGLLAGERVIGHLDDELVAHFDAGGEYEESGGS